MTLFTTTPPTRKMPMISSEEENRDDGTQGSGEVASEPVQRLLEEVTETTHRNRTPPILVAGKTGMIERDDTAAHVVDHLAVVGYHEYCSARAVDALEQIHAARSLRVEIAHRLVADEQRRAVHDGARDGDALLFAAGELVRALVQFVLQPTRRSTSGTCVLITWRDLPITSSAKATFSGRPSCSAGA